MSEIPFPGHATPKSWRGYPREALKHPGRNRPEAVQWLIVQHSEPWDVVYDPMAGVGTTMREAEKADRIGCGDEIDDDLKQFWPHTRPLDRQADLIVTSPPYFGNHRSGRTEKQKQYDYHIGSTAGMEWKDIPGHLGNMNPDEYWPLLDVIYQDAIKKLRIGGKFVVIVRNRIVKGRQNDYVRHVLRCVIGTKIVRHVGEHYRRLGRSARQEQREKLKPGSPWVQEEWALVFERVK